MERTDAEEWLHGVVGKVGEMWSGVCSTLRQAETVHYVERRVQTIGTDVKSFCSEFIQEVFSSTPAETEAKPIDVIPLAQIPEAVQCTKLTEGVSNEIPLVKIPGNVIVECLSAKEEVSVSVDEPDVIVPPSFNSSCCQNPLTEDQGEIDLILTGCQPKASTVGLEHMKILNSFSDRDSESKEFTDTLNHFAPGNCDRFEGFPIDDFPYPVSPASILERDCENEEPLACVCGAGCSTDCENKEPPDNINSGDLGAGRSIHKALQISNIPDAAFSRELADACSGDWESTDCDYIGAGNSEKIEECALLQGRDETMLGESCIMIHTGNPCPDEHRLAKHREDVKKILRRFHMRMANIVDRDMTREQIADESSSDACSTQRWEVLPLLQDTGAHTQQPCEFELLKKDWEII
ncbi:hypothetical protein MLD38_021174 [Melastoma candidum]|uniref:Uncharacterized protein n=1 Tax=Melastoma candidum TaxID=119954 RepID=A0ACB9QFF3_9MYRT|nr:hypothetical protein MLD38_021174 [Melastoma candidum]